MVLNKYRLRETSLGLPWSTVDTVDILKWMMANLDMCDLGLTVKPATLLPPNPGEKTVVEDYWRSHSDLVYSKESGSKVHSECTKEVQGCI